MIYCKSLLAFFATNYYPKTFVHKHFGTFCRSQQTLPVVSPPLFQIHQSANLQLNIEMTSRKLYAIQSDHSTIKPTKKTGR